MGLNRSHLLSSPVLIKCGDNRLASFAVDGDSKLWHRQQVALNASFAAWRQLGGSLLTA